MICANLCLSGRQAVLILYNRTCAHTLSTKHRNAERIKVEKILLKIILLYKTNKFAIARMLHTFAYSRCMDGCMDGYIGPNIKHRREFHDILCIFIYYMNNNHKCKFRDFLFVYVCSVLGVSK